MDPQLTISVADPDADYLGIEIYAANKRYAATTRLYAGDNEVAALVTGLTGFPKSTQDEYSSAIGTKGGDFAGGYCSMRFYCPDGTGRIAVDIEMEDDNIRHLAASSSFTLLAVATEIDRFVTRLQRLVTDRAGEASLR